MTTLYTRTNKQTNEVTTLTFGEAVDQFIIDNLHYASEEDAMTVEEALGDMSTVFESQSMLKALLIGDTADAGHFIYTRI